MSDRASRFTPLFASCAYPSHIYALFLETCSCNLCIACFPLLYKRRHFHWCSPYLSTFLLVCFNAICHWLLLAPALAIKQEHRKPPPATDLVAFWRLP
ncbi:hypothetical protein BJV82DRAFT_607262 [Fennellomyces sp. T-0311]|nr:hypothetical protein BJV82DRAFT_607262 [Fennellomyces sp. T-0311]